jgi:hypothetical protein
VRTITISKNAAEISALLEQAREEDLIVKLADGTEFVISAIDDFDIEVARTRQNEKLMTLLDERAAQTRTIPIDEVKRRLGLSS